jgi:hypothetical protein
LRLLRGRGRLAYGSSQEQTGKRSGKEILDDHT